MSKPVQNRITAPCEFFPLSKCIPYEPWCWDCWDLPFAPKVGFKAQTEREASRWENKLRVNTEAQVWEACLPSPPGAPGMGWRPGIGERALGLPLGVWSEDRGPSASCLLPAHDETSAGVENKPSETWTVIWHGCDHFFND